MGGYAAREHAAWLAVWQDVDLSRLPGFPLWERPVFELLQALPLSPFTHPTEPSCTHRARVHAWFMHPPQACWPVLRSIFHFYCKRGNDASVGHPNQMTLPAFLLWADDCRMRTKLFPQARIQGVFNYCVLRRTRGPWESMPNVEQGEVLLSKVGKDHVLQDDELEVQAKLNANLHPTLILTLTLTLILT
jgi:hypothetical protein